MISIVVGLHWIREQRKRKDNESEREREREREREKERERERDDRQGERERERENECARKEERERERHSPGKMPEAPKLRSQKLATYRVMSGLFSNAWFVGCLVGSLVRWFVDHEDVLVFHRAPQKISILPFEI